MLRKDLELLACRRSFTIACRRFGGNADDKIKICSTLVIKCKPVINVIWNVAVFSIADSHMGNMRDYANNPEDIMQRGMMGAVRGGWSSEEGSIASSVERLESQGGKEGEQNQRGPCKRKNELGFHTLLGFERLEIVEWGLKKLGQKGQMIWG